MDRSGGDTVLARHGDPAANDGVHTAAIYTGLQLANNGDELPQTQCTTISDLNGKATIRLVHTSISTCVNNQQSFWILSARLSLREAPSLRENGAQPLAI